MRAAAKVERVVQTSSSAAIAYGLDNPNGCVFTEEDWSNPDHPDKSPHSQQGDRRARCLGHVADAYPSGGMVAINPGLVLGPVLDKDASASVEVIAKMLRGELPGLPRLSLAIVDVRDIADLHLRAMIEPTAAGQRYIGAGDVLSVRQMAEILKAQAGNLAAKAPTRELPDWLVRLVGLFDRGGRRSGL